MMDVAGAVTMNITFHSPVFPNDLKRQSLPFSYLEVTVTSSDGNDHDVQLYTDVTAEWASADNAAIAEWQYGVIPPAAATTSSRRSMRIDRRQNNGTNLTAPGGIAYHKFYRQTQLAFSETLDQTDYGSWYYATDNVANLTHQSGSDVDVRGAFTSTGRLANTNDLNFRAINDDYPTFGFAIDLGSSSARTLFTIGLTQEDAVQFDGASGNVTVPSLWTSYYANELDALSFFHDDFTTAVGLTSAFDELVSSDSLRVGGNNYVTMTTLAVRQPSAEPL